MGPYKYARPEQLNGKLSQSTPHSLPVPLSHPEEGPQKCKDPYKYAPPQQLNHKLSPSTPHSLPVPLSHPEGGPQKCKDPYKYVRPRSNSITNCHHPLPTPSPSPSPIQKGDLKNAKIPI